jgi:hypothetical protein
MSGPRVLPESAAAAALTRGVSGDRTRHCQSVASFSEGEVPMSFSRRLGRSCVHLALAVALCLGSWGTLQAQTTSASVSGVVMDTSRAVMPGVTITLTSRSQGDVLTTVTDVEGRFVFTIVRPGTYILTASLEGFRTLEQTNLVVNANDRLSAGTLTLDVGSLQESVTVTSRVSELQTTSGERSFAIANEALTNIANNGRQLYNFATLVPGVAMQGDGAGREMTNLTGFTVNGQRPNANNLTIDGVANIDTGDNGGNMASTNIDAVAEFKVLTNAYQAEYGRAVGGQIQVVTKSGTQDFKGSAYWYGRRSDWNATSWINNRDGLVTPKASRDDRGYTIGGPIYIPGGFNADRRRLFFFWSQEYQSRTDPANERRAAVPTALERAGDFSQSVDSGGRPYPYIRDYTTGLPCNASDTRGCFQHQGVLGRIPPDRLYGLGLAALNIYPMPNGSFGGGQNFSSQNPSNSPRREDLIRIDGQVNDNWRVTGRYMNLDNTALNAYGTGWAGNGSDQLPMPVTFKNPGRNWMVSATGILSSTMSLEMSLGSARNILDFIAEPGNWYRETSGLTNWPYIYQGTVQRDYIPQLNFRGGRTGNAGLYQTRNGPFTNWNRTYDVIVNATKVMGPHTAKAGIYIQHSAKPQAAFASWNGNISFVDNVNNPYDTGYAYANAAIGVFNTYQQANTYAMPFWEYKNVEFYVQDNWKHKRLTLDYGMRFYYMTPQWDTSLTASTFLPDRYNPAAAARLYQPVCIGAYPCSGSNRRGMDPALIASGATPTLANTVADRFVGRLTPGSDRFNGAFQAGQGISESMQSGSIFKLSPRIGVVYDISGTGNTIARGGWGIFYDRPQGNTVFDMANNAPSMLQPTLQFGRLQDLASAAGDPNPTLGMQPTAYDFSPPRVQSWNMGVQQKLPYSMVFDLAYVGSKSDNLIEFDEINAVPLGARYLPQNQDPTKPATTNGTSALPDDLLRPYKGYGGIRMWDFTGYSNYHAMQTGVTRRFDRGYMFSAFYVLSRSLGTGNADWTTRYPYSDDATNRRVNYSYTEFHRPHNFVINAIYQVPKIIDTGVAAALVNDWQVSGVYRWNSGRPYSVGATVSGFDLTGGTNVTPRPVLTCDPGSGSSSDPYRQFNTGCFQAPSMGSKGDESARFHMQMPAINNLDMSLSKSFRFYRSMRFEIRADAFNALNHTQFTTINSTANFAGPGSSVITNLPYNAAGQLVNKNGFGTIRGVAPPRMFQLVTRFTF